MNNLASTCFKAAVLFLVVGISFGIFMAASKDHTLVGSHAHINLLGWASLGLFAFYYQTYPDKAALRLARIQVWLHIAAVIVMIIALSLLLYGNAAAEPVVALSSLAVLADVLMFLYIVFVL